MVTTPIRMPVPPEWEFTPPALGELYVNTGTDRVCWVYGWEGLNDGMVAKQDPAWYRFRRVKVQYLDNGRRTKVHLYRWDLRNWPRGASPTTYPRMIRVRPQIRIKE